ncbi:UPF0716 protein FxsA [Poseidonocella pacifica]|uniref:UPF0716 protein FxsA n=1 Tax=Poseidonocella pacifica TaxID=871651 RepID=A0A1I0XWW9_9RHOB|nr:FxsA family protein [Poseidonocella pacifica]SFB04658.1 UPF0716 protein FxsA [Poseidonocella pacifica]
MWLFAIFIAVPLIEIALFIQVGGLIGLWPTLAIVVLTAIAGTYLVKSQGRNALSRIQASFNELTDPTEPLAHGAMILLSGALLLTPGFFTDAFGFSLLFPAVRRAVFRSMRRRIKVQSFRTGPGPRPVYPDTIEGEFEEVSGEPAENAGPEEFGDGTKRPTHRPSGWTKH